MSFFEMGRDFPRGPMAKTSLSNWGNVGSIPGGGNDNLLQYSCLENPLDRGAWQAIQSIELQRVGHD